MGNGQEVVCYHATQSCASTAVLLHSVKPNKSQIYDCEFQECSFCWTAKCINYCHSCHPQQSFLSSLMAIVWILNWKSVVQPYLHWTCSMQQIHPQYLPLLHHGLHRFDFQCSLVFLPEKRVWGRSAGSFPKQRLIIEPMAYKAAN